MPRSKRDNLHPPYPVTKQPGTGLVPHLPPPRIVTPSAPLVGPLEGLLALDALDYVAIKHLSKSNEIALDFRLKNRYAILDHRGGVLFYAQEHADEPTGRMCCRDDREFRVALVDLAGTEVALIRRSVSFLCWPSRSVVAVLSPDEREHIGYIRRDAACCGCTAQLLVSKAGEDEETEAEPKFLISTPTGGFGPEYKITDHETQDQVGSIKRKCDNVCVRFPAYLDVRMKSLLIGAAIMIDFAFDED